MTGTVNASYVPPSLNKLILRSDKIVYGEIICQDRGVVEVKVHEGINHNEEIITIRKFAEWSCGKRWAEYEIGQTSVFFLRFRDGGYYPLGGGNEGELPIHNKKVYVHATTIPMVSDVPLFDKSTRTVEDLGYNNPYNGYVIDLCEFWQATDLIKKCFISDIGATGNLVNIQQLCSTSEYDSILENNKILNWAILDLKS